MTIAARSDANNNFISLGHVAANSLAASNSYHFNDNGAQPQDEAYYRLAIYDRDVKVSHSQIVIIDLKDAGLDSKIMNIAPNPAINKTTLYLIADAPGMVQIDLLNLAGSRVYSQSYSVSKGQNALPIRSIERLMKDVYIVRMVSGSQTACTKLLVE